MPNVKIYSTPHCPYCMLAKNYFNKNNVSFTEVDVEEEGEGREEMISISGQMEVPVIVIDGEVMNKFNKSRVDQLLGLNQ